MYNKEISRCDRTYDQEVLVSRRIFQAEVGRLTGLKVIESVILFGVVIQESKMTWTSENEDTRRREHIVMTVVHRFKPEIRRRPV